MERARFVGLRLGACLRVADDRGGLVGDLVLEGVEQLGLGLLGRHAGNALQTARDLHDGLVELDGTLVELALEGRDLMLARVEGLDAAVERLLALGQAVLGRADLLQALAVLGLGLLLELEGLVLGLDDRLAAQGFGLALSVGAGRLGLSFRLGHHVLRFLGGALGGRVGDEARDDETDEGADDDADDGPDDFNGHVLLLSQHHNDIRGS